MVLRRTVIAFLGESLTMHTRPQPGGGRGGTSPAGTGGHGQAAATICSAPPPCSPPAVKDWIAATGAGRVRYYAAPPKKAARQRPHGANRAPYDDADIASTWHPSRFWEVVVTPSLANTRADFIFRGAPHAAASPHLGRSALDAVELMNVGVNYIASTCRATPASLRPARHRRHRPQRGAGPRPRALFDPRPRPARHDELVERVHRSRRGRR